jgi:pyruvate kinase
MRRTKIVCTIGPASSQPGILRQLIEAGMDVARINLSHGSDSQHLRNIRNVRQISEEIGKKVAVMFDFSGPKIRIGEIAAGEIFLEEGAEFVLSTEPVSGDNKQVFVNYKNLPQDVFPGSTILLDDGLLQLQVIEAEGTRVKCKVVAGGKLSSGKGVNVSDATIRTPAITEKDITDLDFAIKSEVDWIAMSFVRTAQDIEQLKALIAQAGYSIPVIAKIEKHEAVKNIDEIINVSNGIMVARGDLGVEMSAEEVPIIQKQIISRAVRAGKPVITATQMLESMIYSPRPTRAEASDVANAIYDGTDAVMLSAETAAGKYPVEAVKIMATIAEKTESAVNYADQLIHKSNWVRGNTTDAISFAACELVHDLKAKAIIVSTQSGNTARRVSKYRPTAPIIAVSPDLKVIKQLQLSWGVVPVQVIPGTNIDDMFTKAVEAGLKTGLVEKGEQVVITAGVLVNVPGTTNLIKVHKV